MNASTRARVAAVIAASSKGQNISSVYDYSSGCYVNTSVSINNGQLSGYDYSTSTHFSGGGGDSLDFYDYETSKHVQLQLTGNTFAGYDYHSGRHYSGTVSGGSIALYDYETGRYYNFSA